MGLIKSLIPSQRKFTPSSSEVNWTKIETLVHGPGASASHGDDQNSAVFACLFALASAYPEPPLKVSRKVSIGKSDDMLESPLQNLLDNPTPNGELSMDEIRFWVAWAKHVDGNAYWLKVRSGDALTGNVVQLWPISPTLIKPVTRKNSGDWISYYEYHDQPDHVAQVPVKNIVHFKLGLDDRDMRKGLAPLKALLRQISTDEETDHFVDVLLKNYAIPGMVVIPKQGVSLTQAKADDMTERLRRKFGSDNRGNVAVMSEESTVQQFGFSPEQMNLSILHRVPEERISAVIGVPAIVAGLGAGLDRATYANFKEAREMFTEQKLIPLWRADAGRITISLRPDFTNDKRVGVSHDLTDVRAFQEDETAKVGRWSTAVGKPWATRNEARTDTGLDPVEGWDEIDLEAAPPAPPAPPPADQQPADQQPPASEPPPAGKADLERWQRKALKRLKEAGSAVCEFSSIAIPDDIAGGIREGLADCQTADDVKALFADNQVIDPYLAAVDRLSLALENLKAG